jgi:hypothetical protein
MLSTPKRRFQPTVRSSRKVGTIEAYMHSPPSDARRAAPPGVIVGRPCCVPGGAVATRRAPGHQPLQRVAWAVAGPVAGAGALCRCLPGHGAPDALAPPRRPALATARGLGRPRPGRWGERCPADAPRVGRWQWPAAAGGLTAGGKPPAGGPRETRLAPVRQGPSRSGTSGQWTPGRRIPPRPLRMRRGATAGRSVWGVGGGPSGGSRAHGAWVRSPRGSVRGTIERAAESAHTPSQWT